MRWLKIQWRVGINHEPTKWLHCFLWVFQYEQSALQLFKPFYFWPCLRLGWSVRLASRRSKTTPICFCCRLPLHRNEYDTPGSQTCFSSWKSHANISESVACILSLHVQECTAHGGRCHNSSLTFRCGIASTHGFCWTRHCMACCCGKSYGNLANLSDYACAKVFRIGHVLVFAKWNITIGKYGMWQRCVGQVG